MTVWFKQGVCGDSSREMLKARTKIHRMFRTRFKQDLFITAIRDGNHLAGSFHYRGDAEDYLYPLGANKFSDGIHDLGKKLGDKYDIVFHKTHIHVEYDPGF